MLRYTAQNVLYEHLLRDKKDERPESFQARDLLMGMYFHKWLGCMAKAWKCQLRQQVRLTECWAPPQNHPNQNSWDDAHALVFTDAFLVIVICS